MTVVIYRATKGGPDYYVWLCGGCAGTRQKNGWTLAPVGRTPTWELTCDDCTEKENAHG